ncbi:hypothetical protein [Paludisphaera sp.]|uniref:hypothetical protein n=1 Tax=Paludisphaera sp. TaxID=2017432 RepID=UPI00301DAC6F
MLKPSRFLHRFGAIAAALLVGLSAQVSADTVVYSNNGPPGDLETGAFVSFGGTPWSSGNTRSGGEIGIRTNFAQSGNGSMYLRTSSASGAAEAMYWTGDSLGALDNLIGLSYDWYRSSASSAAVSAIAAPALGIYVSDEAGSSGWINYEPYYNRTESPWSAPVDAWTTADAHDDGEALFWSRITGTWKSQSLSAWQDELAGYQVYAVAGFIGSGASGDYIAAIDNISWQFDGSDAVTYNFEVVPEPSSVLMGVIAGGLGLAAAARRRFNRA